MTWGQKCHLKGHTAPKGSLEAGRGNKRLCFFSKNARGEKEAPTVTAQGPLDPDLKINCKKYKTIWKM